MYSAKGHLVANNNDIAKEYMPLVKTQASLLQRKINYTVELADLVQSGMIGLLDALSKFQNNRDAQFETYAKTRIYGSMVDELRKMDLVGQDDRALIRKIDQAKQHLENSNPHISVQELAANCKISVKKYYEIMQLKNSISIISSDDENVQYLMENVIDEHSDMEKQLLKKQMLNLLSDEISKIPEREQQIMSLYYQEELTFKEIGYILELTEARVSQLHNQIIAKLRQRLKH